MVGIAAIGFFYLLTLFLGLGAMTSGDTYKDVYGLPPESAWVPFSQPGIVTIPLGFAVLVLVSLLTRSHTGSSAT